jgi:hypothetical protein
VDADDDADESNGGDGEEARGDDDGTSEHE